MKRENQINIIIIQYIIIIKYNKIIIMASVPNTTPPSGSCLPRQRTLEVINSILSICQSTFIQPHIFKVIVALPLNKILSFTSRLPLIKNPLDLKFFTRVNLKCLLYLNLSSDALQLADVEYPVNAPVFRNPQPVSHWSNLLQDFEWSCPDGCQLPGPSLQR